MIIYSIVEITNHGNKYESIRGQRLFLSEQKRNEEFFKLPPDNSSSYFYREDINTED